MRLEKFEHTHLEGAHRLLYEVINDWGSSKKLRSLAKYQLAVLLQFDADIGTKLAEKDHRFTNELFMQVAVEATDNQLKALARFRQALLIKNINLEDYLSDLTVRNYFSKLDIKDSELDEAVKKFLKSETSKYFNTRVLAYKLTLALAYPSSILKLLSKFFLARLYIFGEDNVIPNTIEGRRLLKEILHDERLTNNSRKYLTIFHEFAQFTNFQLTSNPSIYSSFIESVKQQKSKCDLIDLIEITSVGCLDKLMLFAIKNPQILAIDRTAHEAFQEPYHELDKLYKDQRCEISGTESALISKVFNILRQSSIFDFGRIYRSTILDELYKIYACSNEKNKWLTILKLTCNLALYNQLYVIDLKPRYEAHLNQKIFNINLIQEKPSGLINANVKIDIKRILDFIFNNPSSLLVKIYFSYFSKDLKVLINKLRDETFLDPSYIEFKNSISVDVENHFSLPASSAEEALFNALNKIIENFNPSTDNCELKYDLIMRTFELCINMMNREIIRSDIPYGQIRKDVHDYVNKLIDALMAIKRMAHFASKVTCYRSDTLNSSLYTIYTKLFPFLPIKDQFRLSIELGRYFKNSHKNEHPAPLEISKSLINSLSFYLRAISHAESTNQLIKTIEEMCQLLPEDLVDYPQFYHKIWQYSEKINDKTVCQYLNIAYVYQLNMFRYSLDEKKASELSALIMQLDKNYASMDIEKTFQLCSNITFAVDKVLKKISPFKKCTLTQRKLLKSLNPNLSPQQRKIVLTQFIKRTPKKNNEFVPVNFKPVNTPTSKLTKPFPVSTTSYLINEETRNSHANTTITSTTTISTTYEVKKEALELLNKQQKKVSLKAEKQKKETKMALEDFTHISEIAAQRQVPKIVLELNKDAMEIFEKFFIPNSGSLEEVLQGAFDAFNFRQDSKITRSEVKKLFIALGGEYVHAKGSHDKGKIPSLGDDATVTLDGTSSTLANLRPFAILAKSEKEILSDYAVRQICNLLISKGYTPNTVK